MRIAFTGTSSTGKTTIADRLMADARFTPRAPKFVTADARAMLRAQGHASMDAMSRQELLAFQYGYLRHKLVSEAGVDGYLTDRSFVDVAAYWLERDSFGVDEAESHQFVAQCEAAARRYDLHVYFPVGVIAFQDDGYRSRNLQFHARIDARITGLLADWGIDAMVLRSADIDERVEEVVARLGMAR